MSGSNRSSMTFAGSLTAAAALLFVSLVPAKLAVAQSVQVTPSVKHDTSIPLRDMPPKIGSAHHEEEEMLRIPRPDAVPLPDGVIQKGGQQQIKPSALTSGASFQGLGKGFPGYNVNVAPPDTNLTVGPTQVMQVVNTDFAVFSKTGAVILSPRQINTVWTGFGGGCEANNDGDPVVIFDKIA